MNYTKMLSAVVAVVLLCVQLALGGQSSEAAKPKEPDREFLYILGFYYGNGENILIREEEGRLQLLYRYAQEDKSFAKANRYPLTRLHFDSYTINEAGPMGGSETAVRFERDSDGYGISCRVGGHIYTRSFLGYTQGEREKPFAFPAHTEEQWAQLRAAAKAAVMPSKLRRGKDAKLVAALSVPGLRVKSVYGDASNFFGAPLYDNEKLYIGEEAALALGRAQKTLAASGYGLILYDAYRPWHISKLATAALPDNSKGMLPNPDKQGSVHNTGMAVDVSLVDLATGEELEMTSAFDEPSFRQYTDYPGGTERQRYRRRILHEAMLAEGFRVSAMEWWHFELGKPGEYAHQNIGYDELP